MTDITTKERKAAEYIVQKKTEEGWDDVANAISPKQAHAEIIDLEPGNGSIFRVVRIVGDELVFKTEVKATLRPA